MYRDEYHNNNWPTSMVLRRLPLGVSFEEKRGRLNRRGQKADLIYRYHLMARGTDDDRHFQNLLDQHIQQRATLRRK